MFNISKQILRSMGKRFSKFFCFFISFILFFSSSCTSSTKGGYRIGVDPSFYPLNIGLLEKNVYGFVQEVLLEMAEELNVKFFLYKSNPVDLFSDLKNEKYDGLVSIRYPYNFEKDQFNFSKSFLQTGPSLITMKEAKYNSLADMKERLIGYITGDAAVLILEKYPELILKTYEDIPTMLNDVQNGFLDGAILPYLIGYNFINNLYTNLKLLDPLNDEGLRVLSLKQNPQITKLFDRGLKKLSSKGILQKLQKKWKLN